MPNLAIVNLKDSKTFFLIIVGNVICIFDLIQGMRTINTSSVQNWTYVLRCIEKILMENRA